MTKSDRKREKIYFTLLVLLFPLCSLSQSVRLDTLPLPFSFSEISMISFTADGRTGFIAASNDWEKQLPYLATLDDSITISRLTVLDTIYNGAISPSGNKVIFARRGGQYTQLFVSHLIGNEWSQPFNLTINSGVSGGYFNWFDEKELYFYIPEGNGDLVKGMLQGNELHIVEPLRPLNTEAVEFSPYMDKDKRFLLFTKYVADDPDQQGIMISKNQGTTEHPEWGPPSKINGLTYGWGACIHGKKLYYSDGQRILTVPVAVLGIE